jgi:hypothetical protein
VHICAHALGGALLATQRNAYGSQAWFKPFPGAEVFGLDQQQRWLFKRLGGFIDTMHGFIDTMHGFIDTIHGFIDTIHGFIDTTVSFIDTMHGFIYTMVSFIDTMHGFIDTMPVHVAGWYRISLQVRRVRIGPL